MADQRQARASRRAVIKSGMFAAFGVTFTGGFATALRAFARATPASLKVPRLKLGQGRRPTPVFYKPDTWSKAFFLVEYPSAALPAARDVYPPAVLTGMEAGVLALSRVCPHQGDGVEWCRSSQWFECPSHGSQFNAVGEKKGGPARSGMTMFRVVPRNDGDLDVWPDLAIPGVAIGTNTTGQEAEGPHCIGGGE